MFFLIFQIHVMVGYDKSRQESIRQLLSNFSRSDSVPVWHSALEWLCMLWGDDEDGPARGAMNRAPTLLPSIARKHAEPFEYGT